MTPLVVEHKTTYKYAAPVALHEHRLMLRPRDSHDLRLIATELVISPPASVRWMHDVFGNSIALATFAERASELRIDSTLHLERYPSDRPSSDFANGTARYPVVYSNDDRRDLGATTMPEFVDEKGQLARWTRQFFTREPIGQMALLSRINQGIKEQIQYARRDAEGTQSPLVTLDKRSGTCRDFALLMIEAARTLGFGARFVTGYLYDPATQMGFQGVGATHAWAEIYLPNLGWIEFDPTNGLIGGPALIRVATTRSPSQASPISGGFTGTPGQFIGLFVGVTVTAGTPAPPEAAPQPQPVPANGPDVRR